MSDSAELSAVSLNYNTAGKQLWGRAKVNEVLLANSIKLSFLGDKTNAVTNGVIEELGTFKLIPLGIGGQETPEL